MPETLTMHKVPSSIEAASLKRGVYVALIRLHSVKRQKGVRWEAANK